MPIFSRRTVQRMMDENARFLSADQVASFSRKLNKADETSIHTEWEVALLNVLSRLGKVEHERQVGDKYPDIYLSSATDAGQILIADITTVSDTGLGREGLVERFRKRLRPELGKRRLKFEHFSFDFKRIPEDGKVEDFLDAPLLAFFDAVALAPRASTNYAAQDGSFTMRYDPQQKSYTHSLPITPKTSLSGNPFYNALKNKLPQLKPADYTGARAIILCDGDSDMFFFRKTDVLQYGSDDVIKEFLRRNSSINFVLTVWVERQPDSSLPLARHRVRAQLFPNSNFDEVDETIRRGLAGIESLFPPAAVPVGVALSHIRQGMGKEGWSFHYRSPHVSENGRQIKISARGLLGLLAGEIQHKEFLKDQGLEAGEEVTAKNLNPFLSHLRAGELINDISIERSELDDDYIVITFIDADPAISDFK